MKNIERWTPSKYALKNGRLRASTDPKELNPASRLIADVVASCYWTHIKDHCRGRLLDLGCGKVPLYGVYRNYVSETVCVDWANSLHGNNHIDLECNLTEALPFADAAFDTILLSDVLQNIPTPERLWNEMARVLRPGGKLLLSVGFFNWLAEQPNDYFRYTKYALLRFAETTGFEVILIKELGGAPEIIVDIFAKCIVMLVPAGTWSAVALQAICRKLLTTHRGASLSRATAQVFPFGYFMVARKSGAVPETLGST